MKKALLLTIDFPPMGGGMARHSVDVAEALARIGVDVTVIAPADQAGGSGMPGPRYHIRRVGMVRVGHVFDNYPASVAAFTFAALLSMLRLKPGFIVANTWSIAGVAALFIKKLTGLPYLVFAHGLDVYAPQTHRRPAPLMDAVLENASYVIVNSRFTERLVREATNLKHIVVVNPMVDPARLSSLALPAKKAAARKGRLILTVARLVESKGQEFVIRALPDILSRFPDTVYRIIGGGPREAELRTLASGLGVSDNVEFITEADDRTLAASYRECDLFVLTSRQIAERGEVEGFGIVFLEAGVFAKPVIASNTGGIPDAVIDQVTGILVDPAEPKLIADAVARIFSDSELARSFGEAGRVRASIGFGPEAFAGKLKDLIERLGSR